MCRKARKTEGHRFKNPNRLELSCGERLYPRNFNSRRKKLMECQTGSDAVAVILKLSPNKIHLL